MYYTDARVRASREAQTRALRAATERVKAQQANPGHRISIDEVDDREDYHAAAFCEAETCTWRGDWHHEDEFDGHKDGGRWGAYQAAADDMADHEADTATSTRKAS